MTSAGSLQGKTSLNLKQQDLLKNYLREKAQLTSLSTQTRIKKEVGDLVRKMGGDSLLKNLGGDSLLKNLGREKTAKIKVKKTGLSNKKYNVKTSTAADVSPEVSASGILSGGGGGYSTEEAAGKGFSFSDIPSIVWIILAIGAGIFLIKSAKGKK